MSIKKKYTRLRIYKQAWPWSLWTWKRSFWESLFSSP